MKWKVRGREHDLDRKVLVMGILNVTPDSFSDGGKFLPPDAAVEQGKRMAAEGADIIDVGGESSRPGAEPVAADEELRRVVPVIERLARDGIAVSVDTVKARVAEEAVRGGAAIINDISALRGDPGMARVAARTGAGLVLMHMKGTPRDMQKDPVYADVVGEVAEFLAGRLGAAREAGVPEEAVAVDPGIGFGKTVAHNLELIRNIPRFLVLGRPVLVGPSRKSFIGAVLDLPVEERLEGTAAAVALAVANGARIVRVHDVKAMSRVVRVAAAIAGR